MNPESAITGGGVIGLALAIGYAAKELLAWWQAKRAADTQDDVAEQVTPITNAATVTETALATLAAVAGERNRMEKRLAEIEAALSTTREEARLERLKRESLSKRLDEHDREIGHIKRQFSLAVTYIRSLLSFITDKGLADDAPKPPSGLHLD